jgi:hypothetical protein
LSAPVFLFTPPFTQLNTPYPATAYLKGFLKTKNIDAFQADLGIETILAIFSREGFTRIFEAAATATSLSENARLIFSRRADYLRVIEPAISFLQGKQPTLAARICTRDFLPEASRFGQVDEMKESFGDMGKNDKAKFLTTMFLEDLSDFINEVIDPHFGFSRYAEKLGRSASSFDELYASLQSPAGLVDGFMLDLLDKRMRDVSPKLVAISVPFPGNLFAAFRCAAHIKRHYPAVAICMGGGFPNTELRSLKDPRVFEFIDFITLDDGEAPLEALLAFIDTDRNGSRLKRTLTLRNNEVVYFNDASIPDYKQAETGTPDYSDLLLTEYISAIEVVNPMHSLWSNGRWNKLTMAHGCYWGKCTFCDISLDYIRLYEPIAAAQICDRMEAIIQQTGETGFHFVDEAAPPALMRSLALEILRRGLVVSWWTNIRFEKSFTRDLCLLLKASGCIAVSGGLEVASDRLLKLIQKGITVEQVAQVNRHFTEAGIMVHAYLMYGFPTQTAQETIDSLEMVRQMFAAGVLQSAFWHLFTMTAHSPVGLDPAQYKVTRKSDTPGLFANNDLEHIDPTGAEHEQFAFGLRKSLHNYLHGRCLQDPLHRWFDFKTPKTKVPPDFIQKALGDMPAVYNPAAKLVWLGVKPVSSRFVQSKSGQQREMLVLQFASNRDHTKIQLPAAQGEWLLSQFDRLSVSHKKLVTLGELRASYESAGLEDFELFWYNKPVSTLYKTGLLSL